ncbi:MAG: RNA pyrophosphohydrolase [Gammaproteobacteria bacterium]|nr:RNA pyrophosphohydrolase [Gammaproteobacteria bacterium]
MANGSQIDRDGFRANVGIILCNNANQLLWARRIGQRSWQFPQGGIEKNESVEEALYRELREEIGLEPEDVVLVARSRHWLRYRLPKKFIRYHSYPLCIGQKQIWFMLRLIASDSRVCLNRSTIPEFDRWRWIDYWQPLEQIIFFKRRVYERALQEFESLLFEQKAPDQRVSKLLVEEPLTIVSHEP